MGIEDRDNWILIVCSVGLASSLFSSSLVLLSLIRLKFRDASTELRKYSTITDIAMISSVIFAVFVNSTLTICIENYIFVIAINVHGYWVLYMSYLMHQIIYYKKSKDPDRIKYAYVLSLLIAGGMASIMIANIKEDPCILYYDKFSFYYIVFAGCIPHAVILLVIIVLYLNIRRALDKEMAKFDEGNKEKRELFKRIYGYPVVFFIIGVSIFLYAIQFEYAETREVLQGIRLIILSYYPLLNSLFYGFTQSSKRALRTLFDKNSKYDREESILKRLRDEQNFPQRIIFDALGIPEDKIFE